MYIHWNQYPHYFIYQYSYISDLHPYAIAIDPAGRTAFWTDVQNQKIYSSPLDSLSQFTEIPTDTDQIPPDAMGITYDADAK